MREHGREAIGMPCELADVDTGMHEYESGRVEVAQRPRMRETVSAGVHRDDREALPHAAHARQFRPPRQYRLGGRSRAVRTS
ncbi:uncharacterized protein TRAVEDRAFT_35405 [Trametes versicolor FP-101664 SS1]|uniref:uncharacterized protein n=1 Tax=Trametes versicolor (strain FP-101664) TaxID=717944 RepID=UPI000462406A|nr:uncharacterized protein TRAVEDRAFT_35405 [Trametes versicolor FP-101664 SS1]EIW61987.1 hypothetical protein TRAVEDRAFT_35405 [Trametes versicolor FP-101664 SS1]